MTGREIRSARRLKAAQTWEEPDADDDDDGPVAAAANDHHDWPDWDDGRAADLAADRYHADLDRTASQ
jgi:hypothetical protein